ncbi:MAG: MotA/TolQ/ExbB proton channel family protein [Alphaproteobacteria bacterium]
MLRRGQFFLRYLIVNISTTAVGVAGWMQGWLDLVLANDATRISLIILATFVVGLCLAGVRIWRLDRAASLGGAGPLGYGLTSIEAIRLRLGDEIGAVRNIANSLVFLGLIGTVIGFVIALSAIDPTAAADPKKVALMVAALVDGMGIALTTTLVGSVLHLWLSVNYRLLASGATRLMADIVERQGD